MRLEPLIERYMSLKRRESTLCSALEDYEKTIETLTAISALFRGHDNPISARDLSARIEYAGAEPTALDEVMADIATKAQETRVKCKYTARPQIALTFSELTSRVLTSAVGEIARMKRGILVTLQQM